MMNKISFAAILFGVAMLIAAPVAQAGGNHLSRIF